MGTGNARQILPIQDLNSRIDECVKRHSVWEVLLWIVLILVAGIGVYVLIYGVQHGNNYLIATSAGEASLITWPILKLIKLYRLRIALTTIPAISANLSRRDAAKEIHALVQALLSF